MNIFHKTKVNIFKIYKDPLLIISYLASKNYFFWIPDKFYLKLIYYAKMRKKLNLKEPKTYNEKLQWLKLNDRRQEMIRYVDKFEVRSYVRKTIGEKYLVPLYGVYDSFNEVDFNRLPDQFVMKCTHDSGGVVVCEEKSKVDVVNLEKKMKKSLKRNYYSLFREWPYKYVKPRIICEKYLQNNITDYKIMCFHGEPKLIQVHRNRGSNNYTLDFYDVNWNKTAISRNFRTSSIELPKPKKLDEMLLISKELSKDEIHVRIDLYEINGDIYFSEKTYYSASGLSSFSSIQDDELLGRWIKL